MCGLYFVEILYTCLLLHSLFNSQIIVVHSDFIDLNGVAKRCNQLPTPVLCVLCGAL